MFRGMFFILASIVVYFASGKSAKHINEIIHRNVRSANYETDVKPPTTLATSKLDPEVRTLMSGGPSNPFPRVLKALQLPLLNVIEPYTFKILDEVRSGLKYIFQTKNEWTLAISGSGHLGVETVLGNLLEPGDVILVLVNGFWGDRVGMISKTTGAIPKRIEKPLGVSFTLEEIEEGVKLHKPNMVYMVHGESSTGVLQKVDGVGDICERYNCLLVLDTVGTIASVPVYVDKWKVDAALCNSQKGIGSIAGFAPVTFSPKAVKKIQSRSVPMKSFYTDMRNQTTYWGIDNGKGEPRRYLHTISVLSLWGLREALATLAEETLEKAWERHAEATNKFYEGVKALNLEHYVPNPEDRLITTITLQIPSGVKNVSDILKGASEKYQVELGWGLGPTIFKVIRVGIMGANAYLDKVDLVLKALEGGIAYAKTV